MTEQQHGAVTVVHLDGPLVDTDAGLFRERLTSLIRRCLGRVVVDATAIAFVDSQGLEALLDVSEVLGESGSTLRLFGVNETLREVLDLTDVGQTMEQFEDMTSAVRSFL